MKVDVSARWARVSLTYWLYVTAHGLRPLLVSWKRRYGLVLRLWRVVCWYGRRFGVALQWRKNACVVVKNLLSLLSTHGGILGGGGVHSDLT